MLGVYFAFLLLYSLVILQKGPTLLLTINMIACDQIVSFFSLEKVHPRCLKSCSSSLSSQTNSGSKTVRPAIKREKGLWLWTYLPMDMGRMCYRKKSLLIHFCSPSLLFFARGWDRLADRKNRKEFTWFSTFLKFMNLFHCTVVQSTHLKPAIKLPCVVFCKSSIFMRLGTKKNLLCFHYSVFSSSFFRVGVGSWSE